MTSLRIPFCAARAALALVLVSCAAQARVTELVITKVEPFAGGKEWGASGAYERVTGVAKGELDPADRRNAVIVNLDLAPRNPRGMVEYQTEFFILRPKDAAKGNRRLLYEVNNRGRKFLMHWLMDAPAQAVSANNDPKDEADAGNALFLRMGYTLAWSGWDPDAPKGNNGMAMTAPVATRNGEPVVRRIREELVSATRGPVVDKFRLSYESATSDVLQARLTQRRQQGDPPQVIANDGWKFADVRTIELLPPGTRPQVGTLYELHYQARAPKVLGMGFAATRDFVSYLRNDAAKATEGRAVGPIQHTLAVGISQSGRYLRDHIGQGFNQDESGRKVFDGVLAHISGVGRVFLNAEFGEPARTNTQHEDHTYPENEFPFSTAELSDPVTGRKGALFRGDGFDPLLIEVNTSTEYWQKGASLLHTDPLGEKDIALPAGARVYLVAGTQHGGRAGLKNDFGPCLMARNPHSPAPVLRALAVALDRWVVDQVAPPASRVPTLADGTLVPAEALQFPTLPYWQVAKAGNRIERITDWVAPVVVRGTPGKDKEYRALVPRVDADGNEVAGVRTPDIAVPLGTYTGWNLYKRPFPEGALCDRDGAFEPFAASKTERETKHDPRPALSERYATPAAYVERVQAVAAQLVKERLLLQEDADQYVARAKAKRFD